MNFISISSLILASVLFLSSLSFQNTALLGPFTAYFIWLVSAAIAGFGILFHFFWRWIFS